MRFEEVSSQEHASHAIHYFSASIPADPSDAVRAKLIPDSVIAVIHLWKITMRSLEEVPRPRPSSVRLFAAIGNRAPSRLAVARSRTERNETVVRNELGLRCASLIAESRVASARRRECKCYNRVRVTLRNSISVEMKGWDSAWLFHERAIARAARVHRMYSIAAPRSYAMSRSQQRLTVHAIIHRTMTKKAGTYKTLYVPAFVRTSKVAD